MKYLFTIWILLFSLSGEDGLYDSHPRWPEWYPNGARSDMGAYGGPGNADWLQ